MLTFSEFTRWTGITLFEILLHFIALLITLLLLALKWISILSFLNFWHIFTPLFVASALNSYFLLIVFIRAVIEERQFKRVFMGNIFNFLRVILIALFELLLCNKLESDLVQSQLTTAEYGYNVVFMPIWFLIIILGCQVCRLL